MLAKRRDPENFFESGVGKENLTYNGNLEQSVS